MKLIFWNTKYLDNFNVILGILKDEQPDFLFLAEFEKSNLEIDSLNIINYEHLLNPGCEKIIIIKNKRLTNVDLSIQHNDYSGLYIKSLDLYIISLHMPSQMSYNFDALKYNISKFKFAFEEHIGNSEQKNIVMIGDFNVNPFESPIVNFDGLSATNTISFSATKQFRGNKNPVYYNPTWKLYSKTHFPGSFRKTRPSNTAFDVMDHHYLDQVIISHKLLKKIIYEEIDIIEKTSEFDFFDAISNKILISDHLPIKYKIEI